MADSLHDTSVPRPTVRLVVGCIAVALFVLVLTIPTVFSERPNSTALLSEQMTNPDVLGSDNSEEGVGSAEGAEPGAVSGEGALGAADEEVPAEGEVPVWGPIEAEGLGYSSADNVLVVGMGLQYALANGLDDASMTDWIESAFTFMPPAVVKGWAAEEGVSSAAELASMLTDTEARELSAYVSGGVLELEPGRRCSASDTAAVADRFKELGATGEVSEVYHVVVLTSDYPAGAEDKLNFQDLYEAETPYLAVHYEDVWFFYAPCFVMR